ncbi:putative metallophosphoesterase [Cavenderia fasciculata]|uniref:Metallophosphoesterase n=1 Tax=Cavenderia fasciculata TaxID=261658 RepID=F4PQ10_CACFS|nr:putative metallophosphoesterase [Cavenderia fasciculata]EGG22473.1 putative metallophosphoesterase [Cavenderia fasciculata]|eukprot:XP_004360324.1 putative metallophosphoesterase [Cavenderia fasciculata]
MQTIDSNNDKDNKQSSSTGRRLTNRNKNKMLMEEHESGSLSSTPPFKLPFGGTTTPSSVYGADTIGSSSPPFRLQHGSVQYISANSVVKMVGKEETGGHGHPVSRGKLIVGALVALLLPAVLYVIASRQLGAALSYPFSLIIIPSFILLAPFIYFSYRVKGSRPFVKSRGVTILMTGAFCYYSLIVPIYIACLMAIFFHRETDFVTYVRNEYYTGASWLVAIPIAYAHGCVFTQFALLSKTSLRSKWYLRLVSWPSSIFFTTLILALPLLLVLPFLPAIVCTLLALIPLILSCIGLYQTLRTLPPNQWVVKDILVRSSTEEDDSLINKKRVHRVNCEPPKEHEIVDFRQPLTVVQIADPHLGPIMSIERLEEICESTVKLNPDLVILTGDFFTAEAFLPGDSLERALRPLKKLAGKTFACLGNHDYEEGCLEMLESALKSIECYLLVDECVLFESRIGKVQIVGFDYRAKNRQEHIQKVCEAYPPIPHVPRIGLLHDPGAFKFIPVDYGMIAFSGHTHGGQIGLNCLGINASIVGFAIPDHGLWQNGGNYLYVHTGQGCRSLMGTMVLRVGVPTEDSLLQVFFENN